MAPHAPASTKTASAPPDPAALAADALLARHRAAQARRAPWEALWQDCYDHALPQNALFGRSLGGPDRRGDRLFDGTAADAADQLAASLLAQLAPPWSRWVALVPGPDLSEADALAVGGALDRASADLQAQIDRSNFAVEAHQALLDVVVGGTGCLLVEEAPAGAASALRFTAVPLSDLALEEGPDGSPETVFRRTGQTAAVLADRFGAGRLPEALAEAAALGDPAPLPVIETATRDGRGWRWAAVLEADTPVLLGEGRHAENPFVAFRWMKAPGEVYGRSPVMKALPDIRTANKVVELVLKNASIAVTGIWQADDDGVLNPAAIRLAPGTIIPKAVGSSGLTPLASPGRFDVSQLVLDDLRGRIRHALLADLLGPANGPRMTATEVMERSAEMARLLGATFGRLQSELLVPLARRCVAILRRRGVMPDLPVDGRLVGVRIQSPLARAQARRDADTALRWLESVAALGPEALAVVDLPACARFLAETAGVPHALLRPVPVPAPVPAEAAHG